MTITVVNEPTRQEQLTLTTPQLEIPPNVPDASVREIEKLIDERTKMLAEQRGVLEEQKKILDEMKRILEKLKKNASK